MLPGDNGLPRDPCQNLMIVRRAKALIISPHYVLSPRRYYPRRFFPRDRRRANNRQSVRSSIEPNAPPSARYWHYFSLPIEEFIASFPGERANLLFSEGISTYWVAVDNTQQVIMAVTLIQTANQRDYVALPAPPHWYFLSLFYSSSTPLRSATGINSLTSFLTTSTHTVLCY